MKCKHCGKEIVSVYEDITPMFVKVDIYYHVESKSKYCDTTRAEPEITNE